MDVRAYNREMWNKQVEYGNPWTIPVSPEVIAAGTPGRMVGAADGDKGGAAQLVPGSPQRGGDLVPGMWRRSAGAGFCGCGGACDGIR